MSADGARPQSRVSLSQVKTSGFPEMRFDPRCTAILLVAGDDRWYETNVPVADRLFERHLRTIEKERTEHV